MGIGASVVEGHCLAGGCADPSAGQRQSLLVTTWSSLQPSLCAARATRLALSVAVYSVVEIESWLCTQPWDSTYVDKLFHLSGLHRHLQNEESRSSSQQTE